MAGSTIAEETVRLTVDGSVATVILNRPERLNALTPEMVERLSEAVAAIASASQISVALITGEGRGFCAGADLAVLGKATADLPVIEAAALLRDRAELVERVRGLSCVTVCAVNGACAGAGMAIACAADIRVAASSAVFTTAYAAVGQSGDFGISWTLPRLVGSSFANQVLFTAERFDAHRARQVGLVSDVYPDEQFRRKTQRLVETIASRPAVTLRALKRNIRDSESLSLSELIPIESLRMTESGRTEAAKNAIAAFRQKKDSRDAL